MVVLLLLFPPLLLPPDEEQPATARASTTPHADATRNRALRLDRLTSARILASRLCELAVQWQGGFPPGLIRGGGGRDISLGRGEHPGRGENGEDRERHRRAQIR